MAVGRRSPLGASIVDEVADSYTNRIFYHATSFRAAERIAQQGFRVWLSTGDGERYASGGNLGTGIYVTSNWRIALWFGSTLLRVGLLPGTRVLDASEYPNFRVIEYLKREFGRDLLRKPPWKALPGNKQLALPELIELFRYHYWNAWERDSRKGGSGLAKWRRRRVLHSKLLDDFRSLLIRYGFHGFGNPRDDNGIVVFAGERVLLKELVAEIPAADYMEALKTDFRSLQSLSSVRRLLGKYGSERARSLAVQVRKLQET